VELLLASHRDYESRAIVRVHRIGRHRSASRQWRERRWDSSE